MQLRMAGSMESGPGLLHIRRCHGVVGRTQGEPTNIHTYVTVWPGEVGRGGGMPAASTYYCRLKSSTQQPKVIKDGFGGGITKGV